MKLVPVLRASSSKPCSEIGRGRLIDHIQWGLLVPSDPVEVRASLQQVRGRIPLTAVAGTPEGLGDHLRIWSRSFGEDSFDSVQQPEGGSFTQPGTRPSLDESPGRCPIAESTGVGQRAPATEDSSSRLDVGSGIDQRIEHRDVIAARGPVQWRFAVSAEPAVGIHIGASSDQTCHDVRTVGEMPRPVSCRMQQRPVAALIADPGFSEPWVGSEQSLELRRSPACTAAVAATARGSSAGTTGAESSSPWEAIMAAKLPVVSECHPVGDCIRSDLSAPLRS